MEFNSTQSKLYQNALKKFKPHKLIIEFIDGTYIETNDYLVLPGGEFKPEPYTGKVTLKIDLPPCL